MDDEDKNKTNNKPPKKRTIQIKISAEREMRYGRDFAFGVGMGLLS